MILQKYLDIIYYFSNIASSPTKQNKANVVMKVLYIKPYHNVIIIIQIANAQLPLLWETLHGL